MRARGREVRYDAFSSRWIRTSALVVVGIVAAACSSRVAADKVKPNRHTAIRILPAPKELLSMATPQPNGIIWVLHGGPAVKTLTSIDLSDAKSLTSIGVSAAASAVAQSSTGVVALGFATTHTGAVELLNGTTGAEVDSIAVGAPVRSLAFGGDGVTLYILDGTAGSTSVTSIDTASSKILSSFGEPHDAIAIGPDPAQTALWTVDRSGVVGQTSLLSGKPAVTFTVGGPGIALAVSPTDNYLYVLKGTPAASDIAVVSTATESIRRVLPAAVGSTALAVSPDGRTLYDAVGTPTVGNIQEIPLGPSGV